MKAEISYNKLADTLYIWFGGNQPAVSEDVDGEFWLRRNPTTDRVVGIEIENFQSFLEKHIGNRDSVARKLLIEQARREILENIRPYEIGIVAKGSFKANRDSDWDGHIFVIPTEIYKKLFESVP